MLNISYATKELETLNKEGHKLFPSKYYQGALDLWQRGLNRAKWRNNRLAVANLEDDIGLAYYRLGDIPQALAYYQKALKSYRHVKRWSWVRNPIKNIVGVYFFRETLGEIASRKMVEMLNKIAQVYHFRLKNYPKAFEHYQQAERRKAHHRCDWKSL